MQRFALLAAVVLASCSSADAQYNAAAATAARAAAVSEKTAAQNEYSAATGVGNQFYLRGALGLLNYQNPAPGFPGGTATPLVIGDSQYAAGNWYMAVWCYEQSKAQDASARRWIGAAVRFP
jgi:hypothetical protein